MTEEERRYISALSLQIPGFADYWQESKTDLNTALISYSSILESKGVLTPNVQFIIGAIQRIYLHSIENSADVLSVVNVHQKINDTEILREFSEARDDLFHGHVINEAMLTEFLKKFLDSYNPYVSAKIALPLIQNNKYNEGFTFLQTAANYTLTSPNIYWNNAEAITGCAETMELIVSLLGDNEMTKNGKVSSTMAQHLIEYAYLLLSRVIYFQHTTSYQQDKYCLPIQSRHRISCLAQRAKLVRSYKSLIGCTEGVNLDYIVISDLKKAHDLAYDSWEVGDNSVYLQDASKEMATLGLSNNELPNIVEHGSEMAKTLAFSYYQYYRIGTYALSRPNIAILLRDIKLNVTGMQNLEIHCRINRTPLDSYDAKEDQFEIQQLLIDKGVLEFYHFTQRKNLGYIIKSGGLYSYKRCIDMGLPVGKTKDMAQLRDLDASFALDDYVRLSFCKYHPLINQRKLEGADLIRLKIRVDVASFKGTLFSDRDAVDPNHHHGPTIDDLRLVDFNAVEKTDLSKTDPDYSKNQAEIMVPSFIPCSFIINLDNPDVL